MAVLRDEKGHFQPGPMSPEFKEAISRGQVARHQRDRAQQGERPSTKRCSKCKLVKRVPEDFLMRKRKLKSGEVMEYPAGECKMCTRERSRKYRETVGVEEIRRRNRAAQRRAIAKDPEAHRRKQREWGRAAREQQGVESRGPWKRYRQGESESLVDPGLFLEWLHWNPKVEGQLADNDRRRIRAVRSGEQKLMTFGFIERIMTKSGHPDQVVVLYPPEES